MLNITTLVLLRVSLVSMHGRFLPPILVPSPSHPLHTLISTMGFPLLMLMTMMTMVTTTITMTMAMVTMYPSLAYLLCFSHRQHPTVQARIYNPLHLTNSKATHFFTTTSSFIATYYISMSSILFYMLATLADLSKKSNYF